MSYHLSGPRFYVPRSKGEIIKLIIASGKWSGLKGTLRAMEQKQLRAIFYRIRNEQMQNLMKPKVQDGYIPEQKTEV